jgi:hypothetical protein
LEIASLLVGSQAAAFQQGLDFGAPAAEIVVQFHGVFRTATGQQGLAKAITIFT